MIFQEILSNMKKNLECVEKNYEQKGNIHVKESQATINNIKESLKISLEAPENLYCLFFWSNCNQNFCSSFNPKFDFIIEEFNEYIIFFTIDVKESKKLVKDLSIKQVPSLVFLKNGEILKKIVNVPNYEQLRKIIMIFKDKYT